MHCADITARDLKVKPKHDNWHISAFVLTATELLREYAEHHAEGKKSGVNVQTTKIVNRHIAFTPGVVKAFIVENWWHLAKTSWRP